MTDAIKHSVGIATAAVQVGINLVRDVVAFLAAAPDPTPEEDALNSAIRGGELNHRTGRFDDGTDPAGWYERD
jgi:hypothetical protein